MDKELEGFNLLLAFPKYGPSDPDRDKDIRTGIMFAANHGVRWVGDVSTNRIDIGTSRNIAAKLLLESKDADGLMWVDSDMAHKPHDITRLLISAKRVGADFISGVYLQRNPPYKPTIFKWSPAKKLWIAAVKYPKNSIVKLDACGFGFVYTSKRAIQKVYESPAFDKKEGWFPDKRGVGGNGEDMSFCYQAMMSGVQLYVDTGVEVGHAGDSEIIHPDTHDTQIEYLVEQHYQETDWGA